MSGNGSFPDIISQVEILTGPNKSKKVSLTTSKPSLSSPRMAPPNFVLEYVDDTTQLDDHLKLMEQMNQFKARRPVSGHTY
jgi:hypothetical protein